MDNWILKAPKSLENSPKSVKITSTTQVKVKVSHLLMTDFDTRLYSGDEEAVYPKTLGRAAIGLVTEVGENCYGLEKGARVYFEPTRPCRKCLACRSGKPKECSEVAVAGKDFDGFMRDFAVCEYNEVASLPDSVSDMHALCIEPVGIAENIYDKLNLTAGQKVAVVGADLTGNIIAQVLQYHKIIPVVIDNNPTNLARAKRCGIYYSFAADDELDNHIMSATGGKLCDAVIYCSGSRLNISISTRLVGEGKKVVVCGSSAQSTTIDIKDILAKNLTLFGVSNAYDYTDAVINMLIHGAVNVEVFEKEILTEYNPVELLNERCENADKPRKKLTVLKMII